MTGIFNRVGNREQARDDHDGQYERIRIGSLTVDHSYQRTENPRQVKEIVDHYDPDLIGTPIVHRRQTGRIVVLDGQHRVAALREMFGIDCYVTVQVLSGLSAEEEAELFARLNTQRRTVGPLPLWHANIQAGDEETLRLNDILKSHGIRVMREKERGGQVGVLAAVSALRAISRPGIGNRGTGTDFEHVDRVFRILMTTWPDKADAIHADTIRGMSAFLRRYGHLVDEPWLIKALKRDGVTEVRQRAAQIKTGLGYEVRKAFANAIWASYNKNRRENNRLPSWDSQD